MNFMHGSLKLLHHSHSGRLKPHEHTSYIPLAFLIFIVGVLLFKYSLLVNAATPYTGPEAGSVGLTGTLPEAPPKVAATIKSPSNGQHFATSPITVSGSCPSGTLVEVYKNNIFAGSTPCDSNQTYTIQVDLLYGQNVLTAQVYDVLNQAGPISNSVTVFYDATPPIAAPGTFLNFSGAQLILNTDAAYRGSFPNQQLNVPVTVIGGTAPFAVNVQWGDSTNNVIPVSSNTTFNTAHAYKKPGTYKITLQGTDSKKLVAYLSVAAIINGKPDISAAASTGKPPSNKLLILWPLFATAATLVASFWMGERREKHILNKNTAQTPVFGNAPQPQAPSA
jgi:hypothetical protein